MLKRIHRLRTKKNFPCWFMMGYLLANLLLAMKTQAQSSTVIIPSNVSTGTLEKNLLFYADERYTVSQQGTASLFLPMLFDGRFAPVTTTFGPSDADPTVVLIEGLPQAHTQAGAWVGWSSRHWYPVKFKIEVYNTWSGADVNQWLTVAEVDNYAGRDYMVKLPSCVANKIRFTFYRAIGTNGGIQISELFFIHPEAARAYDGMMVKYHPSGNVGIGTSVPDAKLSVKGTVHAQEVKVDLNGWSDFVFEEGYPLPTLGEVERHIRENGHLKGIPSAGEVKKNGVLLGGMNAKLLQKIEELTLYVIEQDKEIEQLKKENKKIGKLEEKLDKLLKKQ